MKAKVLLVLRRRRVGVLLIGKGAVWVGAVEGGKGVDAGGGNKRC